jgi:hypothetical protein
MATGQYTSSKADLIDFRMAGPDPSMGQPKKMHDVSINISSEVRKLLCPKGLTQEMQDRMLEVTPDVLSCQGKTTMVRAGSEFEVETMWNHLAAAMSDMADVKAQRIGCQPRDTQWNLPSKNALTKVKSLIDAMEFIDVLAANRDSVLDAAKGNYLEVLFAAGWGLDDAKIYCEQGGLIILLTRTYDYFYSMIQQIIGKAYLYPDQWSQVGQPRVDHHSFQLGQHRVFSSRRELMLYKNYTYLRDGQSTGFQDMKLISRLTERLMARVYGNPQLGVNPVKNPIDAKKWSCTHCHGDFHDGGSATCDL